MFNNLVAHQNGALILEILFEYMQYCQPKSNKIYLLCSSGYIPTQKYPVFASRLNPLKGPLVGTAALMNVPTGPKELLALSKSRPGGFIPPISCFVPAAPQLESDLENCGEHTSLVELPVETIWISYIWTTFSDLPFLHTTKNNNCFWVVQRMIMWETF